MFARRGSTWILETRKDARDCWQRGEKTFRTLPCLPRPTTYTISVVAVRTKRIPHACSILKWKIIMVGRFVKPSSTFYTLAARTDWQPYLPSYWHSMLSHRIELHRVATSRRSRIEKSTFLQKYVEWNENILRRFSSSSVPRTSMFNIVEKQFEERSTILLFDNCAPRDSLFAKSPL